MSSDKTLRELADEKGVTIGAGIPARSFRQYPDDPTLAQTLKREFNAVTTANALKMGPLRPERKVYDFDDADAIVNFGVKNDMTVRGHTLLWHKQTPEWFLAWDYTDDQLEAFVRDHIHTVAGRYHDKVDVWDVVNEAVADDGSMRETMWYEAMGEEYLDRAFEWANDVAPNAALYYNDYEIASDNDKADAVYDLLQRLLNRGVPIDGVGIQMHSFPSYQHSREDPEAVGSNIRRFKDLGLDVQVTEMDVAYGPDEEFDDRLEHQAQYYQDVLEACLDNGCNTLITWGVHDAGTWLQNRYDVTTDPLLFDENFNPKPAYYAIRDLLENRS